MMSASLLSDMESFKAANPNGKIEDFIRWYSPRDWIEDATDEDEGRDKNIPIRRPLIELSTDGNVLKYMCITILKELDGIDLRVLYLEK